MSGDPSFMRQAIDLATQNVITGRGGPFGAVIVRCGILIATGVNLVTATNDATAHAEITAIRNACTALSAFELGGCELYSSCEPCPMCLTAAYWAKCTAVYFGNTSADAATAGFDDAKLYTEVSKPAGQRTLPMQQMMRHEASESFAAWTQATRKVLY
ncbi:MAG: nucleoside deaminase [Acidobacteria bacterium]|nr:nucleoside deaminase [Acidobacteriota bacterium]